VSAYRDPDERFALNHDERLVELWTVERLPFTDQHEAWEQRMIEDHVGRRSTVGPLWNHDRFARKPAVSLCGAGASIQQDAPSGRDARGNHESQ
jgi:hypothetical protein